VSIVDSAWVSVGTPTVAAIATAVYTTGGRGALERRVIRQELEIAALLPAGDEKEALERTVRDRSAVYAARRLGQEPFSLRQHAVLLGFGSGSLVVGYAGAMLSQTTSGRNVLTTVLNSVALLMMLVGFTLAATAFTAWGSRVLIANRAQSRRVSIAAHRERLTEHVASAASHDHSQNVRREPVNPARRAPEADEQPPRPHALRAPRALPLDSPPRHASPDAARSHGPSTSAN
jgi:hypothetical protein